MTSSGGARRLFVQSAILIIASAAAARLGLDDVTAVDCCPGQSGDAGLEAAVFAVISSGYSLLTGLLVDPVLVRMCAARTRPSPPLITSSTTTSFQDDLGPSLWTNTTSPFLINCSLVPVVLWNSRREVRYSCLHLFQKRSRIWACAATRCLMSEVLP